MTPLNSKWTDMGSKFETTFYPKRRTNKNYTTSDARQRKPVRGDHNVNIKNNTHTNEQKVYSPNRSSEHVLQRRKISLNRGKSQSCSDVSSLSGNLSPRSKGDELMKNLKSKMQMLNENYSPIRLSEASTLRRPSPTRKDSKPSYTTSSQRKVFGRSNSLNSGNLTERTRTLSLSSQIETNVLPEVPRSRRNSFDLSTSVRLNRPPSPRPAEHTPTSFMSRRSSLDARVKSSTTRNAVFSNHGTCGLVNLGNTCYMSSILQCLTKEKALRKYFCSKTYIKDSIRSTKLTIAFGRLMEEIWCKETNTVNPSYVKLEVQRLCLRFAGYHQHDSQEFLRTLIEGLHDELNKIKSKPTYSYDDLDDISDKEKGAVVWKRYLSREQSVIQDLFVGQLRSTLTCSSCHHASVTFDPFWDLSLPISSKVKESADIDQCFQTFTQEEVLDGPEKPTCEKCKKLRKSTKRFLIERCPKVLVIHLKRFSELRYRTKLSTKVTFPHELDIGQFTVSKETRKYRLFGVSNHVGGTQGGHYTAYCKHPDTLQWNLYNDTRISTVSAKDVITSAAYVLFYELVVGN